MKFISLRTKILVGMVAIVSLLGLMVIAVVQIVVSDKFKKEFEKKAIIIAKEFSEEAVEPILTEDTIALQSLFEQKRIDLGVEYSFILDKYGKVLAHTFGTSFPVNLIKINTLGANEAFHFRKIKTERGVILDIAVPIDKGRLGVVRLGISKEIVDKSIFSIVIFMVGSVVLVLLIGLIIVFIFANRVTKPIFELMEGVKIIGRGNLNYKVLVNSQDEIGRLAEVFNGMTTDLYKTTVSRDELAREITERKKFEMEKIHTQERYLDLTNNLTLGVFRIKPGDRGEFVEINPAMAQLFEALSREKFLEYSFSELYLDQAVHKQLSDELLKVGFLKNKEFLFVTLKGTRFWAAVTAIVRKDVEGEVFFDGLIEDITERKDTQEKLQRNYDIQKVLNSILTASLEDLSLHELLKRMIDVLLSIPEMSLVARGAIFLVEDEPDKLVLKAQRGLAPQLLDICSKVPFGRCLCGRSASSGKIEFANDIDERHENTYKGILPHGHYCIPMLFKDKVIGVITLYVNSGYRKNQAEEELLMTLANVLVVIVEHKRAEETIRKSRDFYLKLFENFPTLIWRAGLDSKCDYFNKAWLNFTGRSLEQEFEDGWLASIHPDDAEKRAVIYLDAFSAKKSFEVEYRLKRFDGVYRRVLDFGRPVYDMDGKFVGFLGSCYDMTERIESEVKMREKIEEVGKLNKFMIGREKRIIEIKKEVDDMLKASSKAPKYNV